MTLYRYGVISVCEVTKNRALFLLCPRIFSKHSTLSLSHDSRLMTHDSRSATAFSPSRPQDKSSRTSKKPSRAHLQALRFHAQAFRFLPQAFRFSAQTLRYLRYPLRMHNEGKTYNGFSQLRVVSYFCTKIVQKLCRFSFFNPIILVISI